MLLKTNGTLDTINFSLIENKLPASTIALLI